MKGENYMLRMATYRDQIFGFMFLAIVLVTGPFAALPKIPIGMNIPSLTYYGQALIFQDLLTTGSEWITFNATGASPWNTELVDKLAKDAAGYPLEIPANINGAAPQAVRSLVNNYYPAGRYVFLYEGSGEITFSGVTVLESVPGRMVVKTSGDGNFFWYTIVRSEKNDHLRNMRLIPEALEKTHKRDDPYPLFLEGLKPFHALRFMDWMLNQ